VSDLEQFRDHCRKMAVAVHTPECEARLAAWKTQRRTRFYWDVPDPGPRPECDGCLSSSDKELFARLADEVDAYLTHDDAPLWEDA
jgi:hypothetical protein